MSAWLMVYCSRSVADVTAAALQVALEDADLHTVAEGFGIEDEDIVDEAISHLAIEPVSDMKSIRFRLRYASADQPPVLIYIFDRSSADEALDEEQSRSLPPFWEIR